MNLDEARRVLTGPFQGWSADEEARTVLISQGTPTDHALVARLDAVSYFDRWADGPCLPDGAVSYDEARDFMLRGADESRGSFWDGFILGVSLTILAASLIVAGYRVWPLVLDAVTTVDPWPTISEVSDPDFDLERKLAEIEP